MMKSLLTLPLVVAIGAIGATGCASKGYVKTQVGQVSDKVDTLGKSVEETQERTRQNEGKITDVDQKAQAAQSAADQADQAAKTADQHAQDANTAAAAAASKADELDKASRRLTYEVVLNDAEGNFKLGKADLPDSAKAKIDDLVNQLKTDPKDVWIEIEGYTDSTGTKDYNQKLGLERAQAVERYLYTQYQIPLHKINVISYGAENPVASNKTKAGRAQNRRVVIKVLS